MQHFQKLSVWRKSHELALETYRVSRVFPAEEAFGMTAQVRRSALSISSNIAEGRGRGSDGDFCRFLRNAMGSASELEAQLLLARDLGYLPASDFEPMHSRVDEVKRMLTGLIRTVQRREGA